MMRGAAVALCLLLLPTIAFAQETDVRSVARSLRLEEFQRAVDELSGPERVDVRSLLSRALSGEGQLSLEGASAALLRGVRERLLDARGLLLRLFGAALLAALLQRFQAAFGEGRSAEVAQWVCFLWVAASVALACADVCRETSRVIRGAAAGMRSFFPPLATLLAAIGGTGSAAVLQPAVTLAASGVIALCERICLPLTIAYLALTIVSCMTDAWSLSRLTALCRSCCNLGLGAALSAFTGVMTVRGFTAAARDGVSLRAAKFAVDSFVPEVGGMLSDAAETVVASSLLVKNALGVTGITLLCAYLAAPLLELIVTGLTFRLAGALMEPVCDGRMARLMDGASGATGMLAACLLCAGAMFLLLVAQAVATGNIAMMMA